MGQSTAGLAAGRGLYVAINDDVEAATVPEGTLICGYGRGAPSLPLAAI